jgi:signal transduction histidine kinase
MQSERPILLMVEQSPAQALESRRVLEQAGIPVLLVKNVAEALAELQQHPEATEDKVQERTRELMKANEELTSTARRLETYEHMRSEFIDNVSHELRTPLASMSVAISNLLKGILGPLPEKLQPYLVMLAQECERLKETVATILDMGRIDAQTLVLHHMKLPFHAWVRRAAGALRPPAGAKRVSLSITDGEVPGFVDADPLKVERVMVSVIKNAVHYAPHEGHVDIEVTRIRQDAWIEMRVTDDGIGVPPEHLSRLTERYYRVGEFVSGTGLGLALCKEILECMGGEIEILSPPPGRPKGTQALIRLPLAPPPAVLAVDDSRTVQMLLERHLESRGYNVTTCGSAEQALALLATFKPDLLIVDSMMPGMDGAELIARIKSDHALRYLPVIMITGAEISGSHRTILEEFRVPVLGKPWEQQELIACMEDAIYGKHYLER